MLRNTLTAGKSKKGLAGEMSSGCLLLLPLLHLQLGREDNPPTNFLLNQLPSFATCPPNYSFTQQPALGKIFFS